MDDVSDRHWPHLPGAATETDGNNKRWLCLVLNVLVTFSVTLGGSDNVSIHLNSMSIHLSELSGQ